MRASSGSGWRSAVALVALGLAAAATPVLAQDDAGPSGILRKGELDGMTEAQVKAAMPEYFPHVVNGRVKPADLPDIFGPGAVLNVGNVAMKVTNNGFIGNPFTNLSSDPAGQWPGVSGIEYLDYFGLAIGAVNPTATDPAAKRRVSYLLEWRPPTLDPVDRIYKAYDGIKNGGRFQNDDSAIDHLVDEEYLDGHDNDGDGFVDEDFAAIGQQMYSCVIRDDTPQAINASATEKHVPLGLEVQQMAWAYSIPGYTDFNVVEWDVFNRSGHTLDSLVVGGIVDMDCGPTEKSSYWQDDVDLGSFPSGDFIHVTAAGDLRVQDSTMRAPNTATDVDPDSALCPRYPIQIHGFSICDDDGDEGKTVGIPTFLLVNHTVDPSGANGPRKVMFNAWRAYTTGTPYNQGGRPSIDQERFELLVGVQPNNVEHDTTSANYGFINVPPGDQKGDWVDWWSCGPWRNVRNNDKVTVTVAFQVARGNKVTALQYAGDYLAYKAGSFQGGAPALFAKYPSLDNAFAVQVAYEGVWEDRPDWPQPLTNGHGRETPVKPRVGEPPIVGAEDCRDLGPRPAITSDPNQPPDWFDLDCDYCTGVYDSKIRKRGMFHHTWNADAPPPNPGLNVSATYNYTDNPNRVIAPGDNSITVAWDNLSEVSPDPKSNWFDFRGYRLWKVSGWTRPVGSAGPSDDDWALVGEFRQFWYQDPSTNAVIPRNYSYGPDSTKICPKVFVPNYHYPAGSAHCQGGCVDTATVDMCLDAGDLWDRQSGQIIRPDPNVPCDSAGTGCKQKTACINGRTDCSIASNNETRTQYPIGRYRYVDTEVRNGFTYFYSITAFDSTGVNATKIELTGRRSAVEAEGVTPQISASAGGGKVWVVPNPYRGYKRIQDRPSSWDLTPNATDPTGTHIDFFGLPSGLWTIRIFTVAGDLVQTIHSSDPVNESIRTSATDAHGQIHSAVTRQQDNANDGQARWNLISRNGQDIVSGVYLFTVESSKGTQRGRFVVIR